MIFDFAVEPELVASWQALSDYRYFATSFGLGEPRIMAEFPKLKNWRRQVLRAAEGVEGLALERITALIGILTEHMALRNPLYDGNISWLANAGREHAGRPFHAILCRENPDGLAGV